MKQADELRFNEDGLIPAIVQDAASKEVLTLAYMNKESYEKTLETKETWFYSRSRQALWHKGETSGNTQAVKGIRYDCDQDALLVLVEPSGPACHTGSYSCFTKEQTEEQAADRFGIMNELELVIAERQAEMPEGAYTTYLFREGVDKILKKVGEEASEVIIAAKNRDHEELKWEAADLLYHLLVLLREQSMPLDDVLDVLKKRHSEKEE
ncbi:MULTISPECIES: bifunctional phosphoribosyl-AMP cyclohydrolase/phosphoribosyl-ATP diphosphatase HisIE [Bacillus]|uniref:bifunctional phosphoribosyl-AMP cyclohydrolase/phosphoribosyl-ATP diphosphatase HisIE n=1 Tax=Bacillus TaxID=1386 RepID=UPI000DC1C007|nr:bifunctional phosphoribosyl-AMP cyclohydrolase/phosphoribosyl-ATP diphosphatase HisIE [Bacillus subtilis]AWX22992.1 bifunctional phosphoribosyl-AMP cyclohydrolase/phosphoribosyl-ATP pyrophosphatase [Bacillus subtilis subsp. subtilis]AYK60735.1 bifunctional phosphoribosyl-AMP cyclohydrolase/phosphoribosyl-ATP diphosphatase HisIE [Bacillus subtilis subsp. subtilis]MEC1876230.1 bifunctional phosphoribosyl-AMP cyclohydrolase/phosphoribosyl-ATP diphosphatase HisIE [Bacillus subtilis]MEC1937095.1 